MPRIPTKEERTELAVIAYGMRLKRISYRDIGDALGVSHTTVRTLCQEYMATLVTPEADEMRKAENDKLDRREALLWRLLDGKYKVTGHGKVVVDAVTGEPVEDLDPIYKADAALGKIAERRAKLYGLDLPVAQEQRVTYSTPFDNAWRGMIDEMNAKADAEIQNL